MTPEDKGFERRELGREAFESQPELPGPFEGALPAVVRYDRRYLDAGGQPAADRFPGHALSLLLLRHSRPCNVHGESLRRQTAPGNGSFALDEPPGRGDDPPLSISKMRDDYIKQALGKIQDPNVLVNVVSRRVKQLKRGNRPLVESLEKLSPEDVALREIIEEKISFETPAL